jgi:hypothetical protein
MFRQSLYERTIAALLGVLAMLAFEVQAEEARESEAAQESIGAERSARGNVSDSAVTTAISDGAPTDYRSEIDNSIPEVFFYTVLEGMEGQTVIHRWTYNGNVMATAKFDVKENRQKVWSSNKMIPEWTGLWIIEVVDGNGHIIDRGSFSFVEPL